MDPKPEGQEDVERRRRRFRDESVVRVVVALLILLFTELFSVGEDSRHVVTVTAIVAVLLSGPYYLAFRTGRALRMQAYLRTSADVLFITTGLYAAGGLGAAQYLAVYTLVPVYSGLVFTGRACLLATGLAIASFLSVAGLQQVGVLAPPATPLPHAWVVTGFNLLVLGIVGVLAAILADAYRASRRRLTDLYHEVQRAHDEAVRLNAYIQRASRLYVLGEVVAGVTHEMRNALQGAFGFLDLARRRLGPVPPEVNGHLDRVQECCEGAMRIIRNTLDVARKPVREPGPVQVGDVARRVAQLKAFDLRRDGITLTLDIPADLPPVTGSSFQLQQVLLNLVANAQDELRSRRGEREVVVAAMAQDGTVLVEVRDSGPGIPPAVLPRLFEAFYTTKPSGTGLGLAISAGIVQELGGRITALNGERGAIFRVALPAARLPVAAMPEASAPSAHDELVAAG